MSKIKSLAGLDQLYASIQQNTVKVDEAKKPAAILPTNTAMYLPESTQDIGAYTKVELADKKKTGPHGADNFEPVKKPKKEGNAFAKAVIDAKKDGIQPGEKVKVPGSDKEVPLKEADEEKEEGDEAEEKEHHDKKHHDDNDVGIILKTNSGRGTTIDRATTEHFLNQIISTSRKNSKVPDYFDHGCMTNEEVSGIYRNDSVRALVSLTRGEGFGLPILEAAASGLPVIATDWSAHTEFLNLGKWIKIDSNLVEIPESRSDGRIFIRGTKWANPSEESFKKKIKKFRESHETPIS